MPKVKGEINLFLDLSHKKHGKNEKCTGNSRGSKGKFMGNNVNPAGKILLIATGGTIACRETEHGLTPVLDRHHGGRPDADGADGLGKPRSV